MKHVFAEGKMYFIAFLVNSLYKSNIFGEGTLSSLL